MMDQGQFVLEGDPSVIFTEHLPKMQELGINIPNKYNPLSNRNFNDYNSPSNENLLSISNLVFKYSEEPIINNFYRRNKLVILISRDPQILI